MKKKVSKDSISNDDTTHSSKFNTVLGELPNKTLRWGITFIFAVFIILLAITLCLKLPHCGGETIFERLMSGLSNAINN